MSEGGPGSSLGSIAIQKTQDDAFPLHSLQLGIAGSAKHSSPWTLSASELTAQQGMLTLSRQRDQRGTLGSIILGA